MENKFKSITSKRYSNMANMYVLNAIPENKSGVLDIGCGVDIDMWIRLLRKYDTYYIAKPMADVRGRNDDRLFNIHWKDIQGSVKMHKLNIARAYKHKSLRYILKKIRWYLKRDKEYFKYMARCIVRGEHACINEGKEILENESLFITRILAYIILFNPASRTLLVV